MNRKLTEWLGSARIPILVAVASGLVGSSMAFVQYLQTPPGYVYTGMLQPDMPQIMAAAREIFETGDGVSFHPNPFSYDLSAPSIYSHFGVTLLGHLWNVTRVEPETIFNFSNVLFAPMMLLVSLPLTALYLRSRRELAHWGTIVILGGGWTLVTAGLVTIWNQEASVQAFGNVYLGLEGKFSWWFLNLYRNTFYGTETFYHLLSLGCIVCHLREHRRCAYALFLLACWAHPFTGAELGAILVASGLVETLWIGNRERIVQTLVYAAILAGLVAYNVLYLGAFPEHRFLMDQWRAARYTLSWHHELSAYGPFLVLPITLFRSWDKARWFLGEYRNRFLLVWAVVVYCLINNEAWLDPPYQPNHFTRGYLYIPLVLLSGIAVSDLLSEAAGRKKTALRLLAALCLVVPVCDNALFVARFVHGGIPYMCLPASLREAYRETDEVPDVMVIATSIITDPYVRQPAETEGYVNTGYWLTFYTKHRPLVGHYITPFVEERYEDHARLFREADLSVIDERGIGGILLAKRSPHPVEAGLSARLAERGWTRRYENDDWEFWMSESRVSRRDLAPASGR